MKNDRLVRRSAISIVLIIALLMAGCQTSTVVTALGDVVTAAELALPVIGSAAGLNPQTLAAIEKYLQAVDGAVSQSSTILAGPGTTAQKSAQIVAAFAAIASGCNCVPAGTPSTIVAVIDAVAQAVAKFLTNFQPTSKLAASNGTIKLSTADLAALTDIRTRAQQNAANVKGLKK